MRPVRSRSKTTRPRASNSATISGRPIITLTSDFGLSDFYVAAMKAVLIRHAPEARLIDVTHQVPRHDILCGAITLERAVDGFLPGTVHLAVVDPGVGSQRRLIVAELHRQKIVCPDNGLITWAARLHGPAKMHEITWRPDKASDTFHGRDILAPVAGMLAAGHDLAKLARVIDDPILLNAAPADAKGRAGQIIQIDHFGNATTNIPHESLRSRSQVVVRVKGRAIGRLKRTYSDVAPGEPLALIGSSGLLELAIRDGSAADALNIRVGDEVVLR
ncbi:MAG: SAM-dependent chlorinase/fluorinase [Anaerolineae bacterium]|nr:SAM-dependent chlorinase/fluorinase [Phycisphaerae bacterium]